VPIVSQRALSARSAEHLQVARMGGDAAGPADRDAIRRWRRLVQVPRRDEVRQDERLPLAVAASQGRRRAQHGVGRVAGGVQPPPVAARGRLRLDATPRTVLLGHRVEVVVDLDGDSRAGRLEQRHQERQVVTQGPLEDDQVGQVVAEHGQG
jgi:hypothetical protein